MLYRKELYICPQEVATKLLTSKTETMVYIVRNQEDQAEIEINSNDSEIYLHIKQGIELPNGEIDFKTYININLKQKEARDLIKSLQLALSDIL